MDIGQANDNELQKAIDDISASTNGTDSVNELEAQIQSQMGVPPVPPMPELQVPGVAPEAVAMPPNDGGVMSEAGVGSLDGAGAMPAFGQAPAQDAQLGQGGAMPETAPLAPETAPVMPGASMTEGGDTTLVAEPAMDTAVNNVEPVDTTTDLNTVKGEIVRDLYGLLDKVEAEPEAKFNVVKEMMSETGDRSMIVQGYKLAKSISDEKAKADALLYLFENA